MLLKENIIDKKHIHIYTYWTTPHSLTHKSMCHRTLHASWDAVNLIKYHKTRLLFFSGTFLSKSLFLIQVFSFGFANGTHVTVDLAKNCYRIGKNVYVYVTHSHTHIEIERVGGGVRETEKRRDITEKSNNDSILFVWINMWKYGMNNQYAIWRYVEAQSHISWLNFIFQPF